MSSFKEYKDEKAFKDVVARKLNEYGCSFIREYYIGNKGGESGNSAFVDFWGQKGEWKFFVEAKNCTDGPEMARALGQCLFYKRFLPLSKPFIVVPFMTFTDGLLAWIGVALRHGVIVTTEAHITNDLEPNRKCPSLIEMELVVNDDRKRFLNYLGIADLVDTSEIPLPRKIKPLREQVLEAAGIAKVKELEGRL